MDNWGKGIISNKILLRKNRFNKYEPFPQESPVNYEDKPTENNIIMQFEIHEDDPYS